MLKRKIEKHIEGYLASDSNKMLIISGARQIGKSYIIRYVGSKMFKNFIEVNMAEDANGKRLFAEAKSTDDFYLALSSVAGEKLGTKSDTLVFIDEIQTYSHLLTMIKFLKADDRYTYIASGSLLGVALKSTTSIPIGSMTLERMYPLDFEEFLWANGAGEEAISKMREAFEKRESLSESIHKYLLDLFKKYLLVGGLPDAVNEFVATKNIVAVRHIQEDVRRMYKLDAATYERDSKAKLKIVRIYDMISSNLGNKKKRVVAKDIEDKKNARMDSYADEFEYLVSSGTALEVRAVSKPSYPLAANVGKNLLKLYFNDIGIFTGILYGNDILSVMKDESSINLGSVYESVVAQELAAHGFDLCYYDNKKKGEVDFLIDDVRSQSVVPIEVKSGKDYSIHKALDRFLDVEEYHISNALVLSNDRILRQDGRTLYSPIYNIMFLQKNTETEIILN